MLRVAVVIALLAVVYARYYGSYDNYYDDDNYYRPRSLLGLRRSSLRSLLRGGGRYYDSYYNDGYGYDPYNRYHGLSRLRSRGLSRLRSRGLSRLGYDSYSGGYDSHYGGSSIYRPRRSRKYSY